jgi:hypothetical protein
VKERREKKGARRKEGREKGGCFMQFFWDTGVFVHSPGVPPHKFKENLQAIFNTLYKY